MTLYTDLLIDELDLATEGGYPLPVSNAASIGQDIKHAILESGYLTQMLAERNPVNRANWEQQIELLAEEDQRIIPGTVILDEGRAGEYVLAAETIHQGNFTVELSTQTLFNPLYGEQSDDQWPGVQDKTFGDLGEAFTTIYMPTVWESL